MVGVNESEEATTGNGESETSAGTHPQTRTHKERTGMYWDSVVIPLKKFPSVL